MGYGYEHDSAFICGLCHLLIRDNDDEIQRYDGLGRHSNFNMFDSRSISVGGSMINLTDMQGIIADAFFNGDTGIAGMVIFAVVMMIIFAIFGTDHIMLSFVMMLPITLIFSALKILPDSMAILLIIVAVAGLASTYKDKII